MAKSTLHHRRLRLSSRQKTLHQQFSRYGTNAKQWLRKCALMLPLIDREQIWKKLKFSSIHHYASVVAGMSLHQSREALRVMKKIQDKPALLKVAEIKGIHAVRPVATVVTQETDSFWAEKAEQMTKNTLEIFVSDYRKSRPRTTFQPEKGDKKGGGDHSPSFHSHDSPALHPHEQNMNEREIHPDISQIEDEPSQNASQSRFSLEEVSSKLPPQLETLSLSLPPQLARRLDRLRKRPDFYQLLEQFLDEVEQEEEATKPEPMESESRYIPSAIKTYVLNRTGGKCAFSGCDLRYYQLHHTQRWALEHVHDPERLVPLCREHNELAHLGLVANEQERPEFWRLRKQPDRSSPKWLIDQKVQQHRWQRKTDSIGRIESMRL